jgi:L-ascorbate metabolism protein UlaG (beta-lactamase superfamily)
MKLWKKIGLGILGVIVLLVAAVLWFGWSLSADIKGERLTRVQSSAQYQEGAFVNVEPQAANDLGWDYLQDQFFGGQRRQPEGQIPVIPFPSDQLSKPPSKGLKATWLGHATVLLEIDGSRLLTDPVLSERASPFHFVGPKRFHPSPIPLEELTGIDAVIVSHDHYDHLDEPTIRHLAAQGTQFYVPLGSGAHLEAWDVAPDQIHDLDWWQEARIGDLTIIATPTRHYSGRGLFDYKATLWSSWALVGPDNRVFYSGDSGYSKLFSEIGDRLGPFDLTLVKIGSYGPGQAWLDVHMDPEDAVQVHLDVSGKQLLPVHWATFNLALHEWDEPIRRTLDAAEKHNVDIVTPKVGETITSGTPHTNTQWWESVN